MYQVVLQRRLSRNRDQAKYIDFIATRAVAGARSRWRVVRKQQADPVQVGGNWVFTCTIQFDKQSGRQDPALLEREWAAIIDQISKSCNCSIFHDSPWRIVSATGQNIVNQPIDAPAPSQSPISTTITNEARPTAPVPVAPPDERSPDVQHALARNTGITLEQLRDRVLPTINELLEDDEAIANSEYFNRFYGRNAHIRTILSSIKSFLETNGQRRNHVVLYGLPACAKSQILKAVARLVGFDAVVMMDGTSTTLAGIYKIYFHEFKDIPVPPIAIIEEMEKTGEDSLRVWLGALDDRGEMRKINAREMLARDVQILCLATVNDKAGFDCLLNGTVAHPGPISSRFPHQLKCPRPDRQILRKILQRDVQQNGGQEAWIEPILRLSDAIETDDPRKVLGWLDGGDRLLTGEYQRDQLIVYGKADMVDQFMQREAEAFEAEAAAAVEAA